MDMIFTIGAFSMVAAVAALLVRQQTSALGLVLSLAACVLILSLGVQALGPILDLLRRIRELSGVQMEASAPILKVIGIGILTKLSEAVCSDAGETSIGKAVTMAGTLLAVYVSLPLLSSVLDLLEEMLA